MSDDEKKKAHEAAHAIVDEMVERDAEDIAELGRLLKLDEVVDTTREELLESLMNAFISAVRTTGEIASKYLKHYITEHEPTPEGMLAMLDLFETVESMKHVSVLTARWNSLHPDQKPIGKADLMAKLDAAAKKGDN